MHIIYREYPGLPRLSWIGELKAGARALSVRHGPWVEAYPDFFCEGVWAGPFPEGDFSRTTFIGTGVRLLEDGILIVPPDHTMDRIFLCRQPDRILFSNSLAFLLCDLGDRLDRECVDYNYWLVTSKDGPKKAIKRFQTERGNTIDIIYYHCMHVSNDLSMSVIEKIHSMNCFYDYASYVGAIKDILSKVAENARAPARRVKFSPIAMLSSGYDSGAIAVLSKSMGNKEALTFTRARGAVEISDSGLPISNAIGLQTYELDRRGYLAFDDMPEVETQGSPSEIIAARDFLEGRILLTGFPGDAVWDRLSPYRTNDMGRGDAGGTNIAELEKRIGFIHFPVPFLSTRCLPETRAVTFSPEMAPWTLNTHYDRPIPRRIIEEAGVPRGTFAQFKKAAGIYSVEEGIENTMTPPSLQDFRRFVAGIWTSRRKAQAFFRNNIHKLYIYNTKVEKLVHERLEIDMKVPILFPEKPFIGPYSYLIHWATEKMIERYRAALADRNTAESPVAAEGGGRS